MQTIIMTVGTSLLTNPDRELPASEKRPWAGQKTIGDRQQAIKWMADKCQENLSFLELLSAETNTLFHLDPAVGDQIILLHSDTPQGLECAETLQEFYQTTLDQQDIKLKKLPGLNYDSDESWSALEAMADLINKTIDQYQNTNITLAATGGFKAESMIVGLVGNNRNIPVCYIHEQFKGLIYLPHVSPSGQADVNISTAKLAKSNIERSKVINIQEGKKHHRPAIWKKLEKILPDIEWIDYVHFDQSAFAAPKNGVKKSPRSRSILWVHLYQDEDNKMALSVETTALSLEEQEQAALELRQRIGSYL